MKAAADEILSTPEKIDTFCYGYLFHQCFWAYGFQDCFKEGKFIETREGKTEFGAINLCKDLEYKK